MKAALILLSTPRIVDDDDDDKTVAWAAVFSIYAPMNMCLFAREETLGSGGGVLLFP